MVSSGWAEAQAAFDPAAIERARAILGDDVSCVGDAYEALSGADALLILTDRKEFESLDLARVRESLASLVVVDGRKFVLASRCCRPPQLLQYWP